MTLATIVRVVQSVCLPRAVVSLYDDLDRLHVKADPSSRLNEVAGIVRTYFLGLEINVSVAHGDDVITITYTGVMGRARADARRLASILRRSGLCAEMWDAKTLTMIG